MLFFMRKGLSKTIRKSAINRQLFMGSRFLKSGRS